MKKKLHIHSDNSSWAGCENMPGIFLQNKVLNNEFDLTLSYRYSKEYVKGFNEWVTGIFCKSANERIDSSKRDVFPLRLPISFLYKIRLYFRPVMALGYFFMLYEGIVLCKLIGQLRPDVLHINNGGYPGATSCNSAAIAGRLMGVPKITYMINSTTKNRWWERPMTWLVKKCVTKFITASKYCRDQSKFLWVSIIVKENASNGKNWVTINWEVIPNTVLSRECTSIWLLRGGLDKAIKKSDIMFLCVGNFEERKGFKDAIEAFGKIKCDNPRVLVIGGSGPEGSNLKKLAEASTSLVLVEENDDFDTYSLIKSCDVLLVPSIRDEDFPNVILIGLMMGKPIVASNICGIPELFKSDFTYLINPGDVSRLKVLVSRLLLEAGERKRLGAANKQLFLDQYSTDKIIERYIDLWTQ